MPARQVSALWFGGDGHELYVTTGRAGLGDEALAARMVERIAHRGPDAVEVLRGRGVPAVMAHCRLSIIGTEDGRQPIYQSDDILVVNGEIYNYADIRAILGESAFETASDSEAILHLFRTGNSRWISKLDGMFAFVLASRDRIIAARDPLGIKPLFRARIGGGVAFASELKAYDGLGATEIEPIGPGELFDSRDGTRKWYRTPQGAAEPEPGMDVDAVAAELRLVLEEAVAKWMVADVEVGAFLSGGLDSSIIAALAARRAPKRLKTFAVGLEGSPDLIAARRVAEHIGSDHHERAFTAEDLAAALDLGIPEVDADHRRLVAHYQALLQVIEEGHGRAAFGIAFHGLIASAREHFAHEEALMREVDFPGYDLHRMAHKKLLRDAHDFLVNILTVYARDERLAVARFIKYWILVHIDTHDRVFTNFVLDRAKRRHP